MDDMEFVEACAAVYRRELAAGRSPAVAMKRQEEFRRNYIITHAKAAAARLPK